MRWRRVAIADVVAKGVLISGFVLMSGSRPDPVTSFALGFSSGSVETFATSRRRIRHLIVLQYGNQICFDEISSAPLVLFSTLGRSGVDLSVACCSNMPNTV